MRCLVAPLLAFLRSTGEERTKEDRVLFLKLYGEPLPLSPGDVGVIPEFTGADLRSSADELMEEVSMADSGGVERCNSCSLSGESINVLISSSAALRSVFSDVATVVLFNCVFFCLCRANLSRRTARDIFELIDRLKEDRSSSSS